jgi:hypothetical protein
MSIQININLLHCLATPIVKIKIVVTSEGSVERNKTKKSGSELPKWTACHYFSVEKVSTHSSDE